MVNQYYGQLEQARKQSKPSFLEGFAEGFITTGAENIGRKKKIEEELDFERKKQIQSIDPEVELYQRKKQVDAELAREASKAAAERMREYMQNTGGDSSTGTGTVPPATDMNQVFLDMQKAFNQRSAAIAAGDKEAVKLFDNIIDQNKQKLSFSQYNKTQGREPKLSLDKVNPPEELSKEDSELFKFNEPNSLLHEKYTGEARTINFKSPSDADLAAIRNIRQSSTNAIKLSTVLTDISSDQAGVSDKSAGEINYDSVALVRAKNILSNPAMADSYEQTLAQVRDVLDDYPGMEGYILQQVGLDKVLEQLSANQEQAPTEETTPAQTREDIRAAYRRGEITEDEALSRLKNSAQ